MIREGVTVEKNGIIIQFLNVIISSHGCLQRLVTDICINCVVH